MKFQWLQCLLPLVCASNFQPSRIHEAHTLAPDKSHHTTVTPRLIVYAQTFTTQDHKPISLLPIITHKTKVTHVILASLHLHETPGEIRLNDAPLNAIVHDSLWEDIEQLQVNGIKVMALLGGAGGGSWKRLSGTESEVSVCTIVWASSKCSPFM